MLGRHVGGLEGRGDQPVDRGDHDEPPGAGFAQRRPRVLGEQERARQQQRDDRLPALDRELVHRRDVLDAGVGHDEVESPEALERRGDRVGVLLGRGQVGLERHPRPVADRGAGRRRARRYPSVAQPVRDSAPDPTRGAGDERGARAHSPGRPWRAGLARGRPRTPRRPRAARRAGGRSAASRRRSRRAPRSGSSSPGGETPACS